MKERKYIGTRVDNEFHRIVLYYINLHNIRISDFVKMSILDRLSEDITDKQMKELLEERQRRYNLGMVRHNTTQAMRDLYHSKNYMTRIFNIAYLTNLIGSLNMESVCMILKMESKEFNLLDDKIKAVIQVEHDQLQKFTDEKYLLHYMKSKGVIRRLKEAMDDEIKDDKEIKQIQPQK